MKHLVLTTVMLLSLLTFTACSGSNSIEKDVESNIIVLTWDQQFFDDKYGIILKQKYPNTHFEVVTLQNAFVNGKSPSELIKKMIAETEPDLIILQEPFFKGLLEQNIFLDLTDKIQSKDLRINDLNTGVLEKGTSSDGRLLGIAPTFHPQFLIRNKDIFNNHAVELADSYPDMASLFNTAKLLSDSSEGIVGLATGNGSLWGAILAFGNLDELKFVDLNQKKVFINTPAWETIATNLTKMVQEKTFSYNNFPNPQAGDLFTAGKVAMTIASDTYINQLNSTETTFDWDITFLPNNSSGEIAVPSNSDEYISVRKDTSKNTSFLIRVIQTLLNQESQAYYLAKGEIPTKKITTAPDDKLKLYLSLYDSGINFSNRLYDEMFKMPEELKIEIADAAEQQLNNVVLGDSDIKTALSNIQNTAELSWKNTD